MSNKKEKEQEQERLAGSSLTNEKLQDNVNLDLAGEPIKPDGRGGSTPIPGSSGSGHGPEDKKRNE